MAPEPVPFQEDSMAVPASPAPEDPRRQACEDKFSMIFRLSPDAIDLTVLEDGTILDVNESYIRMFGYTREEALGQSSRPGFLGVWVDAGDRDRMVAELKAHGEVVGFEAPLRRKDGSVFTALVSSARLEIAGQLCNLALVRDISRRKGLEEGLLQDRNFVRALLDTMNEGVVACDQWGHVALTNRTLQAWHGGDPQHEVALDPWGGQLNLYYPDGKTPLPTLSVPLVRAYLGEVFQDSELTVRTPGLPERRLLANGAPIYGAGGRRLGAVAVLHDVTRQRRAAQAARTISMAVNRSPVIIMVTDVEGVIEFVNPRFTEVTGYPAREAVGRAWPFLGSVENPSGLLGRMRASIRAGRVWKGQLLCRRKDGELFWDAATVLPIKGQDGRIEKFMSFHEDLTRYRLNEKARLESEARFRGLFETSRDGIAVIDTEGRYLDGNQAFLDLLGLDGPGDLRFHSYEEFMPTEQLERERALFLRCQQGDAAATLAFEKEYLRRDGTRVPVELRIWSRRDLDGKPIGAWVLVRDITERIQAQAQLRRLNGELEARVRLRTAELEAANAELDAFSYSVSHDLRAPLRGIDGFSQALLEDFGDQLGPEARHYLERVRAGTQHMGQLIDDLLRLSRVTRGSLTLEALDLTAMAREVVAELRQGEPDRVVEVRVEDGLAARGDPGLVRAVLQNLLGNAWKYTSKVAPARIALFRDPRPEAGGALCVQDNGAGFDMTYVGKLFSAFQRLHSAGEFEGTGIGLAIVQRVIRRHGGRVWAQGAVGQGASFFFTLPEPDRPGGNGGAASAAER
jgi:PAS domain S-box-containing protein